MKPKNTRNRFNTHQNQPQPYKTASEEPVTTLVGISVNTSLRSFAVVSGCRKPGLVYKWRGRAAIFPYVTVDFFLLCRNPNTRKNLELLNRGGRCYEAIGQAPRRRVEPLSCAPLVLRSSSMMQTEGCSMLTRVHKPFQNLLIKESFLNHSRIVNNGTLEPLDS